MSDPATKKYLTTEYLTNMTNILKKLDYFGHPLHLLTFSTILTILVLLYTWKPDNMKSAKSGRWLLNVRSEPTFNTLQTQTRLVGIKCRLTSKHHFEPQTFRDVSE